MRTVLSKSNLRFFLISILILSVFVRCDDNETPFPQVSIYASLALDSQLGNMLPGESKIIDNPHYGIGGLIIYRLDQNTFLAFDRACTYETSSECIVNHEGGNTYECTCCGSQPRPSPGRRTGAGRSSAWPTRGQGRRLRARAS